MSPRAAWRLEEWGFEDVADYVGGKEDWLAYNLPHEGTGRIAGDALRTDARTSGLDATLGDVRSGARDSGDAGEGPIVVLGERDVVVGALTRDALEGDSGTPISEVMTEGPTTVRPSEELSGLLGRMERAEVDTIIVTSSDGRFLGLLDREPAAQLLNDDAHATEHH